MMSTVKPLRILAVTHGSSVDSCTSVRLTTPLDALQARSAIEYTLVRIMPWTIAELMGALHAIHHWDVIWLMRPSQYAILPIIREAQRYSKPVLVDLDDWLLDVPVDNPEAAYYRTRSRREIMHTALRAANAITAATPVIAERCASMGVDAHIIPNAIDCERFVRHPRSNGYVTVAFCGSPSHTADVPLIARPLHQLLQTHAKQVRVVTLGCPIPELHGLSGYTHYEAVPVQEYPRVLSELRIDIGLTPLQDTSFNRAKSDIKYLEYSATGATTIASSVIPYQASIHDSRGVLVNEETPAAWSAAIVRLVEDTHLRQRLANNAYCWVRNERSIGVSAETWYGVFEDHAQASRPGPGAAQLAGEHFLPILVNVALREAPYDLKQAMHTLRRGIGTAAIASRRHR